MFCIFLDEDSFGYKYNYDFDAIFDKSWEPFLVKGKWIKGQHCTGTIKYR